MKREPNGLCGELKEMRLIYTCIFVITRICPRGYDLFHMLFYPWASNHYLPPLYHYDDRRVTKHMRGMEPRYNFWK